MMFKTVSVAALAAALLPTAVWGQDDAAAPDDTTIVVTATRAKEGVSPGLTGSSVTLLGSAALEARQTRVVSDILRDVPGLAVSRAGAVGGQTQVRFRGAEANHTLVLIDGIEASDANAGEFDFGTLLADDGARIEVLRGEQSALYGSDAVGGVIQYITPSGRERPGVSARIEGGSFGTVNGAVRVAGVEGGFDYALNGSYAGTRGYVVAPGGSRRIGSEIGAASGRFAVAVTPHLTLRAVARYSGTDAEANGQDFGTTGFALDAGGSSVNTIYYGLVGADLALLDGAWTHSLTLQGNRARRNQYDDADAFTFGSRGARAKGSYVTTYRFGGDAIRHTLTGAIDVERESYENADPSGFANLGRKRTDNIGLVAQYDLVANDALALGGAVRRDENDRFRDSTTWHVQASYRFKTGTRLHAASGTGVKAPSFFELFGYSTFSPFFGNPDLKAERSRGWEAGIEQSLAGGAIKIDATYFNADLKDEIIFPIDTPLNATTDSTRKGVEMSLRARLSSSLRLDAAYTYLDAKANGTRELRRAKHIASASLEWRAPEDRAGADVTVRYNGAQLDTNFGTFLPERLGDYVLVNLDGEWKLSRRLTLFGRVENLLDDDYQEVSGFRTPGRAAYAGVRVGF